MPWLVLHAAWLLNRYVVHEDGKTSYERRWSTRFNSGLCKFGECVNYKLQVASRQGPRKLDAQWDQGLWLGKDPFSNEALVSTGEGSVTKTRSIQRNPPSQHYQEAMLANLRVAPWDLDHYMVVRQAQITSEEDPLRHHTRLEDEPQREPVVLQEDQPLPQEDAPMRPLTDAVPGGLQAAEDAGRLHRHELRGRERSRERERRELEPLGPTSHRGDTTMRSYRRDPSTIQDRAMPDQERVRRLSDEDHAEDPANIWRRLSDPEDVQMGMVNYIELP